MRKSRLITILTTTVLAVLTLTGCGASAEEKWIAQRVPEIRYYHPEMSEKAAQATAKQDYIKYVDAMTRIKNGEKVEGYEGFHLYKAKEMGDWNSGKIQIADMVFDQSYCMTVEDVREVLEKSIYAYKYFNFEDTFSGYYPALKVTDKKGNDLITFRWVTLEAGEYPWVKETQNYLALATPMANNENVPWTTESVFIPNGYLYYYADYKDSEDTEWFKVKHITRNDILKYASEHRFSDSMSFERNQGGYLYQMGEQMLTMGCVDAKTTGITKKNDYGQTSYLQTYHAYTFEFDTNGDVLNIKQDGGDINWKIDAKSE